MYLNPIHIEGTTLSDAWFQTVYKCLEIGRDFKIDKGSYEGDKRLEFDYITIHIKNPDSDPMLPELPSYYNLPNPVPEGMKYINEYLPYLMGSEIKEGESYTYGQRITKYPISSKREFPFFSEKIHIPELFSGGEEEYDSYIIYEEGLYYINQMELVIWTYKNKGHRNNQLVLQISQPSDLFLKDPPCLRSIDTRIQEGKLHFIVYFRSWDLWSGFPANLCAIELMKQYMANEIGVENGEIIASSKGLHLYSYTWKLAEIIRGKTIEEFKNEKGE